MSPLRLKITLLVRAGPLIAIGFWLQSGFFQLMSFLLHHSCLTAALLASPAALAETVTLTLLNGDTIKVS